MFFGCVLRWQDVIDPGLSKDAWTNEEDGKLLKIVEEQGVGTLNLLTEISRVTKCVACGGMFGQHLLL